MTARIEAGNRNYDFPDASQQGSHFLGEESSIKFIDGTFTPGNLKVQETAGDPVPVEIQKQILLALPEFLTEMVFRNRPINEPEAPPLPEGNMLVMDLSTEEITRFHQPETPHITRYLRPDVINTPEGQAHVMFAKESERNRQLREFGRRIWIKLIQKALDEKQAPHAVHPLKELHNFNGMIVGLPNFPKYQSYREMTLARIQITPEEILTLMEYEASNNILTETDKEEIYNMLTRDRLFARKFQDFFTNQGIIPQLLGHISLTWDLIRSLEISEEEIVTILSYKLANNLLDDHTAETIKEIASNPINRELIDYLLNAQDQLIGTPLGKVDLLESRMRSQIREILELPFFREELTPPTDDLNFGRPLEHQTRMSRAAMEAASEPPHDTSLPSDQILDLDAWDPPEGSEEN